MTKNTQRYLLVFLILWLHVTVLDLFYVTTSKIVFLWEENFAPLTLVVHFATALIATLFYIGISHYRAYSAVNKRPVSDKFWLASSFLLAGLIAYFIWFI
ncbi:hypothetical protein [Thalassotalea piscium]|uniref:Uncharacterized protein n=1 Tax=Thalassotalea piscium TaxID=1230533 RepID=A0A7X0NJM7_9GAMM|nr:hypothetical protein [Thalassotalea piscium]MBB6544674.1 hypothetical protein [Thalassotalea piscium]